MSQSVSEALARSGGRQVEDGSLIAVAKAWEKLGAQDDFVFPLDGPAARLLHLSMLLNRTVQREFQAKLGISMPVFRLLSYLDLMGACTLKQLAEEVGMDKAQISRVLAGMVKDGYVGFSGPHDSPTRFSARTKAVLIPPGKELLERTTAIARPFHMAVFEALTPAEYRTMYKVLTRLIVMAEEWETASIRPKAPQAAPLTPRRRPAGDEGKPK